MDQGILKNQLISQATDLTSDHDFIFDHRYEMDRMYDPMCQLIEKEDINDKGNTDRSSSR